MKVHKGKFDEFAPCGVRYYEHPKYEKVKTAWHWRNVTCKKCLKHKPKK